MRHLLAGLFVVAMFSGAAYARPFDYNARARPSEMGPTVRDARSVDRTSRVVEQRDRRSEARSEVRESRSHSTQGDRARQKFMNERCASRANGGCGYENTGSAGEPF